MSYRLEYQWAVFHVPGELHGLSEDRYVVAIEGGDSNVYNCSDNKRSRSWSVCMIGTKDQVLMQTVRFAAACEGGGLQPRGRNCTPESYIQRIRRLIDSGNYAQTGSWSAVLSVAMAHPILDEVRNLEVDITVQRSYGDERAHVLFAPSHYSSYFRLIDNYHQDVSAWWFAEVRGLPRS